MKKLALAVLALALPASLSAQVYVSPHVRSDGTYVQGHYRSAPNNSTYDNYSTRGNVNPYTGRVGTQDPYGSSYSQPSYGSSYSNPYGSTTRRRSCC